MERCLHLTLSSYPLLNGMSTVMLQNTYDGQFTVKRQTNKICCLVGALRVNASEYAQAVTQFIPRDKEHSLSIFTGSLIHEHYTRECEFGNLDKKIKKQKTQIKNKTKNVLKFIVPGKTGPPFTGACAHRR